MGRRLRQDTMPENPTWIEFNRSDGHSDHWPTTTKPKLDDDQVGYINYYRLVPVNDSEPGRGIKWRRSIATSLAQSMKLPSKVFDITHRYMMLIFIPVAGLDYVLKDWPDGYALFKHCKGPVDHPREDFYLYGII
jgi:hypothetical protein